MTKHEQSDINIKKKSISKGLGILKTVIIYCTQKYILSTAEFINAHSLQFLACFTHLLQDLTPLIYFSTKR